MNLKNTSIALATAILVSAGTAFADGNAFTPLNFDDTVYSVPSSTNTSSATTTKGLVETTTVDLKSTGNEDIQNALSKLDAALDDIRNEQIQYKGKYADVDAQYKLIKNERSMLKKQVRAIDKRIKSLDKAKEKIRKNVI